MQKDICKFCNHVFCPSCENQGDIIVCCRCGTRNVREITEGYEKGNTKELPQTPRPLSKPPGMFPPNEEDSRGGYWQCSQCKQVKFSEDEPPPKCEKCSAEEWVGGLPMATVCPVCGQQGQKKTMSALAAEVEKRMWENVKKRAEQLIREELSAIDEIIEAFKTEIQKVRRPPDPPVDRGLVTQYAELLKVRTDMRTQAVSNLLRAKRPEIIKKT